jgi:hypothetical protein
MAHGKMVGMRARSDDTDPEAEKIHFELLRKAGPARRAQMAIGLSAQILTMARRGVQRDAPHASRDELNILFVERVYGRELAADLRRHLAARRV